MQQAAEVGAVLHGQRLVEVLGVVELRDLLGVACGPRIPRAGPPGRACSRQNVATVTMRITARAWRMRLARYR